MRSNPVLMLLMTGILIALLVNGYFLMQGASGGVTTVAPGSDVAYHFLSPRILQENQDDILVNFFSLRRQIRQEVSPYQDDIAYYFEYLPSGTSIGVNSNAEFASASLIKLPVVIAYYHAKERLPQMGDPTVTIEEDDLDKGFGDLWKKGAGYKIKLSDAVKLSLVDSDNTAIRIVGKHVPDDDFDAVYEGIDINLKMGDAGAIMTAKNYSSVLKSLYFSSLLKKDDSEMILSTLSQTKFHDQLQAGVPQGVTVAHKIGVLGEALYSDCGIVYVPKRSYVLCLISKSDDKTAKERMKKLSKMTYDFVAHVNKK